MRYPAIRRLVLFGIVVLGWTSHAAHSQAAAAAHLDLPVQSLANSLRAIGSETRTDVLFDPKLVAGMQAPALKADLTAKEALGLLLKGTGLRYEFLNSTTVIVTDAAGSYPAAASSASNKISQQRAKDPSPINHSTTEKRDGTPEHRSSMGNVASSQGHQSGPGEDRASIEGPQVGRLQEIIVSAEKRTERALDVPMSLTAINTDVLASTGQTRLQDYFTQVPGLNATTNDFGYPALNIRGLSTGEYTNPTVAITIDDVPFGPTSSLAAAFQAPDFDPSDLQSIEVLRGPQGTLYGASSLGGLIRYVTAAPSLNQFSAHIQMGYSGVHNGAQPGYQERAAVNVPLGDTVAIRASGFAHQDPGYINDPNLNARGINAADSDGGYFSLLWRPTDAISLDVSALLQSSKADGLPFVTVTPGAGDLEQAAVRNSGANSSNMQLYSAVLKAQLGGGVELASVSSYSRYRFDSSIDLTPSFGPATPEYFFGVTGTVETAQHLTEKVTQELRLSGAIGTHFDWLLGLFYDHERTPTPAEDIWAEDPNVGVPVGDMLHYDLLDQFRQYAAFSNLTFHLTGRLDIQLGGRASRDHETYNQSSIGPFNGTTAVVTVPQSESSATAFTYLVAPRYKVSHDITVYARLASGYRPGGPNENQAVAGIPATYHADKTKDYEVGVKSEALDHRLSLTAALYYIDWRDIQLSLVTPNGFYDYYGNGSRAKSEGAELSIQAKPSQGMTASAWVTWNEAVVTEAFPASSTVLATPGDWLPYSSRYSGNLSLQQTFPLPNAFVGYVGGTVSYVGNRKGAFTYNDVRENLPGFAKMDLVAGVRWDSWDVSLYGNNVIDKRGVLNGGVGSFNQQAIFYIQPRTVGATITKEF